MGGYSSDPLDILELVHAEKPLKALDFCYQLDNEHISILDAISLCVTVAGYAADSQRAYQMFIILEAMLPIFLRHLQGSNSRRETSGVARIEHTTIHSISGCMRTLINNCELLTRYATGFNCFTNNKFYIIFHDVVFFFNY